MKRIIFSIIVAMFTITGVSGQIAGIKRQLKNIQTQIRVKPLPHRVISQLPFTSTAPHSHLNPVLTDSIRLISDNSILKAYHTLDSFESRHKELKRIHSTKTAPLWLEQYFALAGLPHHLIRSREKYDSLKISAADIYLLFRRPTPSELFADISQFHALHPDWSYGRQLGFNESYLLKKAIYLYCEAAERNELDEDDVEGIINLERYAATQRLMVNQRVIKALEAYLEGDADTALEILEELNKINADRNIAQTDEERRELMRAYPDIVAGQKFYEFLDSLPVTQFIVVDIVDEETEESETSGNDEIGSDENHVDDEESVEWTKE